MENGLYETKLGLLFLFKKEGSCDVGDVCGQSRINPMKAVELIEGSVNWINEIPNRDFEHTAATRPGETPHKVDGWEKHRSRLLESLHTLFELELLLFKSQVICQPQSDVIIENVLFRIGLGNQEKKDE